ncbi:tail fiber protein [Hymenobacter sp. 5317J-9]|uniref:phage tail protein n=1 Tax=Hymenobacter sp. 5317J-9 TaxID=2932250 RepID=UPI001FD64A82|nr:tail fiber protein [Hymenobacter sp. 5317J-9]UOQ96784.1 tail fiber protein [Hymenobacter sp. 5317J-9]
MASPYIGEIRTVGFNFAPVGWLQCQGQLVNISEYDMLYALIGTTYGGDGQSTFALPDLRSRVNVAAGQGPGLSRYEIGQQAGVETVTLVSAQLAPHAHPYVGSINASTGGNVGNDPTGKYPGNASSSIYGASASEANKMATNITGMAQPTGGNQPHANIQPVLALNAIICYEGIYPPQP